MDPHHHHQEQQQQGHHHHHHHEDDQRLWDELSHEHSREIQQHQDRHYNGSSSRQYYYAWLGNAWEQTSEKVKDMWHKQRGSYRRVGGGQQTDASLDDFGLPHIHGNEPLLNSDSQVPSSTTTPSSRRSTSYEPFAAMIGNDDDNESTSTTTNNNTNNNDDDAFILLHNTFRLRPKRDGWGAVANLDLFFSNLYYYYYHRGFVPIVCKGIVELFTLWTTLILSILLFCYLDWSELTTCTDETTCHDYLSDYFRPKKGSFSILVLLYCILFIAYGIMATWSFYHTICDAYESKWILEEKLGISSRKLEGGAIDWCRDVVDKLIELQHSGEYRFVVTTPTSTTTLDALSVAQRILRKENFMIAFFNQGNLLNLTIPFLPKSMIFYSKSLEWSIYFCVLNYMFNPKYQIRPAFYLDSQSLKRRFILCGIVQAIFLPFLLFFMTLHFSMQNIYDWKSTKQYMGPKEWSPVAKWTIREYNELTHLFEKRLEPSYDATETYLKLFPQNEIMTTMGRLLVFIGGALGSILLAFAAVNDAILLHVKVSDWNLLWYAGIMAAIYSTGKAMLPNTNDQQQQQQNNQLRRYHSRNLFHEMNVALEKMTQHTHYYPSHWKNCGWKKSVHAQVNAQFLPKAKLFLWELASVIVAPYLLIVQLPQSATAICEFVLSVRHSTESGTGDVCGYSTFDFDLFGDEEQQQSENHGGTAYYHAPHEQSLTESVRQLHNVEAALNALHHTSRPKSKQGKMEKSFFSFQASHPTWKINTMSGQELVNRIDTYKQQHEQEANHHRHVVARQLETLAVMEQQQQQEQQEASSNPVIPTNVDESYLGRRRGVGTEFRSAGADSGGGGGGTTPTKTDTATSPPLAHPPTFATTTTTTTSNIPRQASDSALPFADTTTTLEQQQQQHGDSGDDRLGPLPSRPLSYHRMMSPPTNSPPFASTSAAVTTNHPSLTTTTTTSNNASSLSNTTTTMSSIGGGGVGQRSGTTFASFQNNNLRSSSLHHHHHHSNSSVLHYADAGLSTELLRVLNRSTLTDGPTTTSRNNLLSLLEATTEQQQQQDDDVATNTRENYLWLERYRQQQQSQQQQQQTTQSLMIQGTTTGANTTRHRRLGGGGGGHQQQPNNNNNNPIISRSSNL